MKTRINLLQFVALPLVAVSVLIAGRPAPCLGQYVIERIQKAVVPDLGKLSGIGTAKPSATAPKVDAFAAAVIRNMVKQRQTGMPTPKGPEEVPGVPVPGSSGGSKSVPPNAPPEINWPGAAADIVGGVLARRRRPGVGRNPLSVPSNRYPQTGQASGPRPPRNVLPGRLPQSTRKKTVVLNPTRSEATLHFAVDGNIYSLRPGDSRDFGAGRDVTIEFDRGNSQGVARYLLSSKTYEFTLTPDGWDLFEKRYNVTIDNRRNGFSFYYLIDDRTVEVHEGETMTHESGRPIVVTFDRGDGGEAVRKTLSDGTYTVGVNPSTSWLDLLPVAKTTMESKRASNSGR